MLRGLTEIALLPYDPGSTTDAGIILDDHNPRRLRYGLEGELPSCINRRRTTGSTALTAMCARSSAARTAPSTPGSSRSPPPPTGCPIRWSPSARATNWTSSPSATTSPQWRCCGTSTAPANYRSSSYADNTLHEPIPLPGMVASELSISAGGSMVAMTVEGPSMPPTVELVDPRTREWEPIDREPSRGPVCRRAERWRPSPPVTGCSSPAGCSARRPGVEPIGAMIYSCTAGPRGRAGPATTSSSRRCWRRGSPCSSECPRFRGIWPNLHARRRQGAAVRGDRRRRRLRCAFWSTATSRRPDRIALLRLVLRRLSDAGGADLSSRAVRRRHQHLRDERLEHVVPQHRTMDRGGGLPQVRPPGQRPRTARAVVAACYGCTH